MKSLTSYLTGWRLDEATHSHKYLDQLRAFIQDQRDNNPEQYIMFPEIIKPWGTGSVHDLALVGYMDGGVELRADKPNIPVIGAVKFEGKVYIIFKYSSRLDYTPGRKRVVEFDTPKYVGHNRYYYTYILCDINDRYGDSIEDICKPCTLFSNNGSGIKTKNPYKQNNEIYIKLSSINISSIYDAKENRGVSLEEAEERFNKIQEVPIDLYTIDLKLYKELIGDSDNAPERLIWGGDTDALYKVLLQRGKIIREFDAWISELSEKINWYKENGFKVKESQLKQFIDKVNVFYKDLTLLRGKLKEAKDGKIDNSETENIYRFTINLDHSLYAICDQKNKTGVRPNRTNKSRSRNTFTRLQALFEKPFLEPDSITEDAPSFEMETQCPTLITLIEILYNKK